MFCKKCGAQLDDDAQFCEKCGTAIKRTVPVAAAQDEDVEESDSVITDDKEPEAKITTAGVHEDNGGSEQAAEVPEDNGSSEQVTETHEDNSGGEQAAWVPEDNGGSEQAIGVPEDNNGSEQTAGKKQNKALMTVAIIIAVAIIAALCMFLKPSGEVAIADPKAQANFNNYGKMAFDESNLYFVGKSDSEDEETCVYATSYSGTDKRILSENDEIERIRITGDRILYYAKGDSKSSIGIMDKNGANDKVIIDTVESVSNFDLALSKLYYLAGGDLHCCTIEGKNDKIILKDVDDFIISGKLYYTSQKAIYEFDLIKSESTKVCDADARELLIKDNTIFFVDDSGLYSVAADGSGVKTALVSDSQVGQYTITDDTIFYVKEFTADEVKLLADYFNTENDSSTSLLYQVALTGTGTILSCPVSGGESKELDTDPPIAYCIYSYPGGMYSSLGPLFDTLSSLTIK